MENTETTLTLVRGANKPDQVRSYVETEIKEAVERFSNIQGMTDSQGMRRLLISGFRAEGWNVVEVDSADLSAKEKRKPE